MPKMSSYAATAVLSVLVVALSRLPVALPAYSGRATSVLGDASSSTVAPRGAGMPLGAAKVGSSCRDDPFYSFRDDPDKTCSGWVAADPGARCGLPVLADPAPGGGEEDPAEVQDFCLLSCSFVTASRDGEADACASGEKVGVKYIQCTRGKTADADVASFREDKPPPEAEWTDTGFCFVADANIPATTVPLTYAESLFEYFSNYTDPVDLRRLRSPQSRAMTWIAARGTPLDDPFLLDTYVMVILAFHWKFADYYHLHPHQKRPVVVYTGHPTTSPTKHPTGDPYLTVDLQESQPISTYESYRGHMNSPTPPRGNGGLGSYRGSLGNRRTQTAAGVGVYCTWPNVNCNSNGRVHDIDLGEMGLDGTIPHEIGYLAEMTQLDLSRNRLTGHVPSRTSGGNTSRAVRPPYFAALSALLLSENRLGGPVPTDVGADAPRLARLDLDHNALTGPLPGSIFSLTGLTRLNLHRNSLTGTLSRDVGRLQKLRFLSLYDNQFDGTVPQELGGLSNLEGLYLDHNTLTGRCGEELCQNVKRAGGSLAHLVVDCTRVQCTCATECAAEV